MFSILKSLTRIIPKCATVNQAMFHLLAKPNNALLTPITSNIIPNCGFKVKGRLKKRCKDCYFVVRQQRLYVICETHPRHKQMSMVPREKNTWILTAATQGKIRQW